ncbi:MAG TPA: TlpA disulfide reductase family protein [Rubrivivax sp.]|nr:TlpA disulfide reductase family protein [Rubrivivax sp.]
MSEPTSSWPPLLVSHWFNTPQPMVLDALRGRVVVIHAFQMLCPACVVQGLPQLAKLRETFPEDQVVVIGLHTVFEHHSVMGPDALEAFIHEYRLRMPIGVDQADPASSLPRTMAAWDLQGTPSLIVLDRNGTLRLKHFGVLDDMALGAVVGQLVALPEMPRTSVRAAVQEDEADTCSDQGCKAVVNSARS